MCFVRNLDNKLRCTRLTFIISITCHNHVNVMSCYDSFLFDEPSSYTCHSQVHLSQSGPPVTVVSTCVTDSCLTSHPVTPVTVKSTCHSQVHLSQSCPPVTVRSTCHSHVHLLQSGSPVTVRSTCVTTSCLTSSPVTPVKVRSTCHSHVLLSQSCPPVTASCLTSHPVTPVTVMSTCHSHVHLCYSFMFDK